MIKNFLKVKFLKILTDSSKSSKIISYKMLDGYINEENEVVLIDNYSNTPSYIGNVTTNATPQRQVLTVKCRNCGATNKFITGKENRCEYCDSLLTK